MRREFRASDVGRNPQKGGTPATDGATPDEVLLIRKYQDGIRNHLNHLPDLFRAFTGLACRISWAPAWPHTWSENDLPARFPLCRCVMSQTGTSPSSCRRCALRHLGLTLQSGHDGHRFTCPQGVHNCWQPVIIRRHTVGLVFVQALDCRKGRARTRDGVTTVGRACRAARRMSRSEFNRSSKLLQLIFEHIESMTLADLRKSDLDRTRQALAELQTMTTHLREDLNGLIPSVHKSPPSLQPENHAEQMVHRLLERVTRDYATPITLKAAAASLNLSTAYLSTLFTRHVGISFKAYLTTVRLEKARELLGDPRKSVSDIACTVGYASENRFRIAFKHTTGLSPRAWRETLRMNPV